MENSTVPSSEILALHERFREIKHSVNNTIAVFMALSELAQRNPAHYEKLTQAVLSRCPDIVSQMQAFQQELLSKVKPELATKTPPPMSGRL
jgi:two-component sensor histidine kinase